MAIGVAEDVIPGAAAGDAAFIAERERLKLVCAKMTGVEVLETVPKPAEVVDDFIARSTILCFGGNLTLVPKSAVLNIPEEFEQRLESTSDSVILTWAEFLPLNRGWVTTLEVTGEQAVGNEPIPKPSYEKMKKGGSVVVATLNGNPVTISPSKSPPNEKEGATQTTPDK